MFHSFYFLNNLHFYSGERVILRVREFVITGHCVLTLYIIKILLWLTTKLMPRPHGLFPAQWHLSEDLLFPKKSIYKNYTCNKNYSYIGLTDWIMFIVVMGTA